MLCATSNRTSILLECAKSIISLTGLSSPIVLVMCAKAINLVLSFIIFFKLCNVTLLLSSNSIYLILMPILSCN